MQREGVIPIDTCKFYSPKVTSRNVILKFKKFCISDNLKGVKMVTAEARD